MASFKLVNCRTNILLDKHLSAKLGDLGFAKEISKVVGNRSFITTKLVAKTLGYSPPEMDTGKLSPKGDVYSYGVVSASIYVRVLCLLYYSAYNYEIHVHTYLCIIGYGKFNTLCTASSMSLLKRKIIMIVSCSSVNFYYGYENKMM